VFFLSSEPEFQTFIELQAETTPTGAELLAADLAEITEGVEIRDQDTLIATPDGRATVVTLFQHSQLRAVLDALEETLRVARDNGCEVDPVTVRQREAREDEWIDVWKQFFRTTRIGRSFVVQPSWDPQPSKQGDRIIHLDPGRAFGTGAHPSTQLVLAHAEDLAASAFQAERFLDLGCGSGILSIAAAQLWPQATGIAVDIDPDATACTDENLARNKVASVTTRTGDLETVSDLPPFPLVMANIQAEVLAPLAPQLATLVTHSGRLLLSGILCERAPMVRAAFARAGFRFKDELVQGEWTGLDFER